MKPTINTIDESICSIKLSLLLKEKGFNVITEGYYSLTSDNRGCLYPCGKYQNELNYDMKVSAPTHNLVIEWIRVNFGLIVSFYIHYDKFVGSVDKIDETKKYNYINLFNGRTNVSYDDLPTTPGKALEPAIYYVLNNCI